MSVANPSSFRAEAKSQVCCKLCGSMRGFHAHHVVDKAALKRAGIRGDALYDTRNAMRLCEGLDTKRCHMQFENRRVAIPTSKLSDDNIAYAFEVLGAYAVDYLRREYDDTQADARLEVALASTLET